MCDSFVALPPATLNGSVILAKSADCQINEAHALLHIPGKKHIPGEAIRATHLVIPQAPETYEMFIGKSFWTYGAEIGFNEHGVAIGNEAVFTSLQKEEKAEGLMVIDMLRIGLERGKTALGAVEAMTAVLEQFGQGGNCELAGNSHFDGSYLIADKTEAWVLETAGRQWVARKLSDSIGSISNVLGIHSDYDLSSLKQRVDWAATYGEMEIVPKIGSVERQCASLLGLETRRGKVTVQTAFDILRQHGKDYDPATAPAHTDICVHAGPGDYRLWQATGAMVAENGPEGVMGWFTGTSGNCVSIFKPVFPGVALPDLGPYPNEQYNPQSLWWQHELLHRRAMADFHNLVPEIRVDFDAVEAGFLAEAPAVLKGSLKEKQEFVEHCFCTAAEAMQAWTNKLAMRKDLAYADPAYRQMWQRFNAEAGLSGLPA
jgi:secernin